MTKTIRIIVLFFVLYVGVVAMFESMLGYFQPENQQSLVMTTYDIGSGEAHNRVLSRIEHDGQLFVAVNHWPRQWYYRLLENNQVQVRYEDISGAFTATKVDGADEAALRQARPLGLGFRILTGFPPRYFVELTPNAP
jgi:hypothetical protein